MSNQLVLPCSVGQVSDGYHTFDELYDHRCLLFIALGGGFASFESWKSRKHDDGSSFDGWFVAGIDLSLEPMPHESMITYHIPDKYWDLCGFRELEKAPKWDGHTSQDVLDRLKYFIENQRK